MTPEQASYYLAAIIDGEGTVKRRREQGNKSPRVCKITNTTPQIIAAVEEACAALGITCKVEHRGLTRAGTPLWDVCIRNMENFAKLAELPIRHPMKRQRIQDGLVDRRHQVPVCREGLRRLHWQGGFTLWEIARQYGVTAQSVRMWFAKFDLPSRTPAQAAARRRKRSVK